MSLPNNSKGEKVLGNAEVNKYLLQCVAQEKKSWMENKKGGYV